MKSRQTSPVLSEGDTGNGVAPLPRSREVRANLEEFALDAQQGVSGFFIGNQRECDPEGGVEFIPPRAGRQRRHASLFKQLGQPIRVRSVRRAKDVQVFVD